MKNPLARLRQDDDGHWYLIPVSQVDLFSELLDSAAESEHPCSGPECEQFNQQFGQYMIDGYQDVVCLMPSEWIHD